MLTQQEQALLDKHMKTAENEARPLVPVEIDLKRMTLRDLETYREATQFQMLSVMHEHLGDVELYNTWMEDLTEISKDEKKLRELKDKLLSKIRDEKNKEDKEKIKQYMDIIDNLFKLRENLLMEKNNAERQKQRMAEWKYNYFMHRIELINKAIRDKARQEVWLAIRLLVDAVLIFLHVKRKPLR